MGACLIVDTRASPPYITSAHKTKSSGQSPPRKWTSNYRAGCTVKVQYGHTRDFLDLWLWCTVTNIRAKTGFLKGTLLPRLSTVGDNKAESYEDHLNKTSFLSFWHLDRQEMKERRACGHSTCETCTLLGSHCGASKKIYENIFIKILATEPDTSHRTQAVA